MLCRVGRIVGLRSSVGVSVSGLCGSTRGCTEKAAPELACAICGRAFSSPAALSTHISLRHAAAATTYSAPIPATPSTSRDGDSKSVESLDDAVRRVHKIHSAALRAAKLAVLLCKRRAELANRLRRTDAERTPENLADPFVVDVRPFGGPVPPSPVKHDTKAEAVRVGSSHVIRIIGKVGKGTRAGTIGTTRVVEFQIELDAFLSTDKIFMKRWTLLVRLYGRKAASDVSEGDLVDVCGVFGLHPSYSLDENKWFDNPVIHVFGTSGRCNRV
jgi:hypothetical protein